MNQKICYCGYWMFPLEATWAYFLDLCGIRWEYEPDCFVVNGRRYWPDFYLPDLDLYLEIKRKGEEPPDWDLSRSTCPEVCLKPMLCGESIKPVLLAFGDPLNIIERATDLYGWSPSKAALDEMKEVELHWRNNRNSGERARAHRWTWGELPKVPRDIQVFKGKYRDSNERAAATVPFEPSLPVGPLSAPAGAISRMKQAYRQALEWASRSKFGPA